MNISPFAQKTKFKKERIRMRISLLLSTALVSVFAAAQANAFEVKDGETINLNTIFKDGIGVGLIAPTYSLSNLVLSLTDNIAIKLARDTEVIVTADKAIHGPIALPKGDVVSVSRDVVCNLSLFGYDLFCCPNCRKNRNSTVINDQYLG